MAVDCTWRAHRRLLSVHTKWLLAARSMLSCFWRRHVGAATGCSNHSFNLVFPSTTRQLFFILLSPPPISRSRRPSSTLQCARTPHSMATTTTILRAKTPTFVQHPYPRNHTPPPCRPLRVVKKSSQNEVDKSSPIHTPNQTRSSSPVHFNKQRAGEQERERERDRKAGAPTGPPRRPLVKAASFELISSSRPLAAEKVRAARVRASAQLQC